MNFSANVSLAPSGGEGDKGKLCLTISLVIKLFMTLALILIISVCLVFLFKCVMILWTRKGNLVKNGHLTLNMWIITFLQLMLMVVYIVASCYNVHDINSDILCKFFVVLQNGVDLILGVNTLVAVLAIGRVHKADTREKIIKWTVPLSWLLICFPVISCVLEAAFKVENIEQQFCSAKEEKGQKTWHGSLLAYIRAMFVILICAIIFIFIVKQKYRLQRVHPKFSESTLQGEKENVSTVGHPIVINIQPAEKPIPDTSTRSQRESKNGEIDFDLKINQTESNRISISGSSSAAKTFYSSSSSGRSQRSELRSSSRWCSRRSSRQCSSRCSRRCSRQCSRHSSSCLCLSGKLSSGKALSESGQTHEKRSIQKISCTSTESKTIFTEHKKCKYSATESSEQKCSRKKLSKTKVIMKMVNLESSSDSANCHLSCECQKGILGTVRTEPPAQGVDNLQQAMFLNDEQIVLTDSQMETDFLNGSITSFSDGASSLGHSLSLSRQPPGTFVSKSSDTEEKGKKISSDVTEALSSFMGSLSRRKQHSDRYICQSQNDRDIENDEESDRHICQSQNDKNIVEKQKKDEITEKAKEFDKRNNVEKNSLESSAKNKDSPNKHVESKYSRSRLRHYRQSILLFALFVVTQLPLDILCLVVYSVPFTLGTNLYWMLYTLKCIFCILNPIIKPSKVIELISHQSSYPLQQRNMQHNT